MQVEESALIDSDPRQSAGICVARQERAELEAAVLTAPQSKKVYLSFPGTVEPIPLLFVAFYNLHFT